MRHILCADAFYAQDLGVHFCVQRSAVCISASGVHLSVMHPGDQARISCTGTAATVPGSVVV